jgi:hypothetical protein
MKTEPRPHAKAVVKSYKEKYIQISNRSKERRKIGG